MSGDPKIATATWIPFTSGDLAEICMPFFRYLDADKPISVYMTGSGQHVFQETAQRAAYSVYAWAEDCSQSLKPCYVGLDLSGVGKGALAGESGGVAFAVALAKRLLDKDPGPVVATGRLLAEGKIAAIDGLAEKITAAAGHLPPGGWFLFPEANLNEADNRAELEQLLESLKQSGRHVHALSSVVDALALLFCKCEERKQGVVADKYKRPTAHTVIFLMLLACAAVAALWSQWTSPELVKSGKFLNLQPAKSQTTDPEAQTNLPAALIKEEQVPLENQRKLEEVQPWVIGQGHLSRELARQASILLQREDGLTCQPPYSEIRMLGLTEELSEKGMISTLNVAVSEGKFTDNGQEVQIPSFQMTLRHMYPIERALPGMALQLVDHWREQIRLFLGNGPLEKKTTDLRKNGFE